MERRRLRHSDLQIAPLAFGGNVFGWTIDEPTSFSLLAAELSLDASAIALLNKASV